MTKVWTLQLLHQVEESVAFTVSVHVSKLRAERKLIRDSQIGMAASLRLQQSSDARQAIETALVAITKNTHDDKLTIAGAWLKSNQISFRLVEVLVD